MMAEHTIFKVYQMYTLKHKFFFVLFCSLTIATVANRYSHHYTSQIANVS